LTETYLEICSDIKKIRTLIIMMLCFILETYEELSGILKCSWIQQTPTIDQNLRLKVIKYSV
jgi:hypothetical protein